VYNEASIAVEDKLIADATGRNALYKIHVSLGKITNTMKEKSEGEIELVLRGSTRSQGSRKSSVAPSVVPEQSELGEEEGEDEKTELPKVEEDDDDSEGTLRGDGEGKASDELLEELLSDGDVEMSGI
jgi:condensin complex subunit 3